MPRNCLVIVNPISGLGSGRRKAPVIADLLQAHGFHVAVMETDGPGAAFRAAAEIDPAAVSLVVCVGGDGTVNEIVNGLGDKQIPVAVCPTGTGNVLAKEYTLPTSPRAVTEMILRGRIRLLDVGVMGARRFLLFAGIGFDATVALSMHRRRTGRICMLSYVWPTLKSLATYQFPVVDVTVDGQPAGTATTVIVSNVHSYGGPFGFVEDADPADGRFDICLLRGRTRFSLFRYVWGGFRRRMLRYKDVSTLRGGTIELRSAADVPVQLDGDFAGRLPARIDLLHARMPVIVP